MQDLQVVRLAKKNVLRAEGTAFESLEKESAKSTPVGKRKTACENNNLQVDDDHNDDDDDDDDNDGDDADDDDDDDDDENNDDKNDDDDDECGCLSRPV